MDVPIDWYENTIAVLRIVAQITKKLLENYKKIMNGNTLDKSWGWAGGNFFKQNCQQFEQKTRADNCCTNHKKIIIENRVGDDHRKNLFQQNCSNLSREETRR